MADNRNTLTDEILVLAETLGDIKARFERVESEFAIQSRPLEAALAALSAAMTGIKTLQHHVLDNSLSALSLKVEEQRKAIDDQINVIVSELKGADAQNDEKIALQTAELKQQFAEICANVQQLSSQFDAQIKRVELEAKEQITKFAAVTGPQGPAGASFNPKGNWQEGVFYQRLDVVSLLGTSYVSNVDNNASKPNKNSDKWTVLAARAGNVGGGGAANFGSIAGVAEINQGGTGQTTALAGARALLDGISTTTGDILYRGSSGWTSLTAGAADTVLKSQGSGAAPQWAATSSATAATNAQAAAGTSTTTFITPANAEYAAAPVVNARAPRQGLVFNGTAGGTIANAATIGTADFTIAVWMNLRSTAGSQFILTNSIGTSNFQTSSADLVMYRSTGSVIATSTNPLVANKTQLIVYTRSGTTGQFYVNGVAFEGTKTDANNYTTFSDIGGVGSSSPCNGTLIPLIYNRALSASEVVALYEAGAPSGADYGSPAASNTSLSSSAFVNSALPYGTFTGSSATGFTAAEVSATAYAYSAPAFTVKTGSRIRVSFTATLTSGQAPIVRLDELGVAARSANQTVVAGSNSFDLVATGAGSVRIIFLTTAATSYAISGFSAVSTGLLLAPDAAQAGNGLVWTDLSGNGAHVVLPTSGVSWNVKGTGAIRVRGATYTNGNQLLLGAATVPVGYRILSIAARLQVGGTPNVTLGSSSGSADYAASTAITSTSWKYIPVASGGEITTTTNFWVGSSSTAVVFWDITAQPLDY